MSNSPNDTTLELEPTAPAADEARQADVERTPAAGRLDSPIERVEAGTPDTFIPEAVDQLLAHSRRYPLLTPAQEIDLAKRIERGDLHAKELLVNSNLGSSPRTRAATRTRACRWATWSRRACSA